MVGCHFVLHGAHRIVALELALLPRSGNGMRAWRSARDPLFGHLPGDDFRADVVGELARQCRAIGRDRFSNAGELFAPLLQDDLVRGRADDLYHSRVVVGVPGDFVLRPVRLHLQFGITARAGVFAVGEQVHVRFPGHLHRVKVGLPRAVKRATRERNCRHQQQR